jgi:hypothetical protein
MVKRGRLGETNVSIKLTPMNSFFTRTSPSFGVGTGKSVFHCKTSAPPVFSMITPDIVLGREDILRAWSLEMMVRGCSWAVIDLRRWVLDKIREVRVARLRDMN